MSLKLDRYYANLVDIDSKHIDSNISMNGLRATTAYQKKD